MRQAGKGSIAQEGDRKKYFYEWAYPVPEGKKNYTKPSDKFVDNYLKSKGE